MSFAVTRYKSAGIETASPAKIVVALYDGALKQLRLAAATEKKDYARRGEALSRAHAIVSELQATLDRAQAPELVDQLDRLYDFCIDRINSANLNAEPALLPPAIKVLEQLRGAWAQVAEQVR
jgi:flagellar protein FliS